MKKTTAFLFMLILGTTLAKAVSGDVPPKVLEAFKGKYPGAEEVSWEQDGNNYIANFLNTDGYYSDASFGKEGSWIETTTIIDEVDLPEAVAAVIAKSFDEESVNSVMKIDRPSGLSYGVNVEDDEEYFVFEYAPSGKLLSKKKAIG